MADNTEPKTPLLRWSDVVAWLPWLTKWKMKTLVEAKLITPTQARKGSKRKGRGSERYYNREQLKTVFQLGIR